MKKEILNLADDLDLKGTKRKAFIDEMVVAIGSIGKNNYDQFYAVADTIMQKYY
jgi:hypothetical protein